MSILDTNLAVILDLNYAQQNQLTDEQLFEYVAQQIRRIPGVRQVYEYQLTREKFIYATGGNLTEPLSPIVGERGPESIQFTGGEEIFPNDRFRGDIEM